MLLNPYRFGVVSPSKWNSGDKSVNITLSNSDMTAACATASQSMARATNIKTSGKWYFEVLASSVHTAGALNYIVGVCEGSLSTASYPGSSSGSIGWRRSGGYLLSGGSTGSATFVSGDIIGVAVDFPNKSIWFSKNGTWTQGDPAANTSPARVFASTPTQLYPAISFNSATSQNGTGKFISSDFSYSPPSGFLPWD